MKSPARMLAQRRICIRSLKNGICHLLMIAFLAFTVGAFHPCFSCCRSRPQHNPVIKIESEVMFLGRHRLPSSSLLPMSSDDTTQNDDLQEWKAVVSAFQMYKAAYGDLKVPTRFVVPSIPPWPKRAWGLKLGQRVAAIRATGKYINDNTERRKILDEMGFVWRLRTTPSDEKAIKGISAKQIFDAIEAYKAEKSIGDDEIFSVPDSFVVPNADPWPVSTRGLPLGKKLATMRTQAFLSKNPKVEKKLEEIGIQLEIKKAVSDTRFEKVYDALKAYKEINGDLLVPQPFVVPEDDESWPESTWGLRLGARVNAIRSQGTFVSNNPERKELLDELGFVWTPPISERGRRRGRKKNDEVDELDEKETVSDLDINEPYPESTMMAMDNLFGPSFDFGKDIDSKESARWGLDGEPVVENIKQKQEERPSDADYVEEQELDESLQLATELAIQAGIIEKMGDDKRIRKGKQYKSIPLYNDDFGEYFVFDDVVEALAIYKKMYGDFSNFTRENVDFIVPTSELNVFGDEEAMAFDSAASARAAAAIAAYEQEGRSDESEDLIAAQIKRLQEEVESPYSMTQVAESRKVKSTSLEWPEHLAGMQLGHIVRRIRDGSLEVKHLPERKAQLDEIGFDWGDDKYFLDIPFEKAMCAFYAYYLVRGDMFVWDDFVMPDEDPWPTALAGYEIGNAVKRMRELQNFIEAYHPDKVQMLRMIDFVWFPSLALPLDPSEGGPSLEDRICASYGHPNYFELPEIPPTLMEKIFENGPVNDDDDPKLWYKRYYDWEYVKDLWYDAGCRDRAFALQRNGYPKLAAEHAEKYGTGYYEELFDLLDTLDGLTKEYGTLDKLDEESKDEYSKKLLEWRERIVGTCDLSLEELTAVDEQIDHYLADILDETDEKMDELAAKMETEDVFEDDGSVYEEAVVEDESDGEVDYEYEYIEEEEGEGRREEYEYWDEESEPDEDTFDVEDELGLADS